MLSKLEVIKLAKDCDLSEDNNKSIKFAESIIKLYEENKMQKKIDDELEFQKKRNR